MPFFSYKARNARGESQQGVLEAQDSYAVANQLALSGLTPIDINLTESVSNDIQSDWLERLTAKKVESMDVQLFSRQLYTLLRGGVPIMRGLAGLEESASNKTFARVIKDMRESLDAGRELSAAMRRHPKVFSEFYTSLVRVGEMTGRQDEVFLRLFDYLEFDREMKQRIKSALKYPMFVIIVMVAAITIVNIFVIPAFAKVYAASKAELPLMTKILINFSDFTVQYWPLMLLALIGAVIGFRAYVSTKIGEYQWDKLKLRIPLAGSILLRGTLSRFARSFALTSRSGVPLVQAFGVVSATVDNAYIAKCVDEMRDGVGRGESILRTAIATGIFTPIVLQMISVGEETGELDTLMDEIAKMYEREVDYELKSLSSNIEPILIVFLGALVLVLALGIFLPMWNLGNVAMGK